MRVVEAESLRRDFEMRKSHIDVFGWPHLDRETISGVTGFDSGEQFEDEDQVRLYFDYCYIREALEAADVADIPTQATLNEWADAVVSNGWHMRRKASEGV